ncbi:unnamed protein product [Effrenium voratum]|uniref:Protein-serine/threonine kinase n=1 Tax=Effrenium voratum TaxID=2562239 RepID=A0AA36MWT6_9DINO|nr:unnamed protein product [Effrenium voratum]
MKAVDQRLEEALFRFAGACAAWAAERWLREQLPIRFARRIEDILQLPHVAVINPQMNSILNTYLETFEVIHSSPPIRTEDDERVFLQAIATQLEKHNPGTRLIAEGYREVRRLYPYIRLDDFLHDHFTTRIATRILMDNYVEMRSPKEGYVGVVCQNMQPLKIVQEIAGELTPLTRSLYGCAPEVEYRGNPDCVLDYIPRHVKYMVRELLKNAFRSTVERHLSRSTVSDPLPHVAVELQQGDIHVIFKISDQGGGMPKRMQREAWKYGWTTVNTDRSYREAWQYAEDAEESCSWDRDRGHGDPSKPLQKSRIHFIFVGLCGLRSLRLRRSELAGYGFGLPLTRLHAQYFGGDVFMQALPGHGTDLILILTHLKAGTPSTEIDDLSTLLYKKEVKSS